MAGLDDVYSALKKADAAGDTEGAKKLAAYIRSQPTDAPAEPPKPEPSFMEKFGQQAGNLGAGLVRGAGSIGATLLAPVDAAARAVGVSNDFIGRTDRREQMDAGLKTLGAEPDSFAYGAGKLGGEIAGTAGAGGVVANALSAIPKVAAAAPGLINAVRTAGMEGGAGGAVSNAFARAAGGAINGAATAGLANPSDAATGAAIGGALPTVLGAAGKVGSAIGSAVRGTPASPEVQALAQRAKDLGIDIPADRLVNSKPLNAAASTLNYVPFSGRAATEAKMESQLNTAASKAIGQNTPNMTKAIRDASVDLGGKFDTTLQNNTVKMTPAFKQELAAAADKASSELSAADADIIHKQIAMIQTKGASGEIDGQTAYNIKKTLDRIGNRNSNESHYALDLKKSLMGALNDSLGPKEAEAFAKVRQQYGNMLALEKIAKNGAEGDISVARLANMKNINNPDLQELADIAAQFVKSREGQHGAAQRATVGGVTAYLGGLPGLAAGAAVGRATNMALNSNAAKNMVLGQSPNLLGPPAARELLYRGAPALGVSQ